MGLLTIYTTTIQKKYMLMFCFSGQSLVNPYTVKEALTSAYMDIVEYIKSSEQKDEIHNRKLMK